MQCMESVYKKHEILVKAPRRGTMGNKARGCGRETKFASCYIAECYICLSTTPSCFTSCSAQANAVLSADLMYESGVSIGKGSDLLITIPEHRNKVRELAFVMDNVVRG